MKRIQRKIRGLDSFLKDKKEYIIKRMEEERLLYNEEDVNWLKQRWFEL
jgi:hypothetical protein